MIKYRKAFYDIEKLLKRDSCGVVLLLGMRKTGKTTILQQLAEVHGGTYIDFRNSKDGVAEYLAALNNRSHFLFLDEVGYLESYDVYFESMEHDVKSRGKKVVLTSSSYTAMKQLATEKLGGGRSKKVMLYPLSFEEYLYFSGRSLEYGGDYLPTASDVEDFFRLRGVPYGMDFVIDKDYLIDTFSDAEVARSNMQFAERGLFLTERQYSSVLDLLSYTLNRQFRSTVFGQTKIGVQEYGASVTALNLSESLINYANEVAKTMEISDIAMTLAALYANGFLFVDLKVTQEGAQTPENIITDLSGVRARSELVAVLKQYVISVISPLLYTRLLTDIEDIVGKLYSNAVLRGRLYELAVKSEIVYRSGFSLYPKSYKLNDTASGKEIDLLTDNLLLESTVETKTDEAEKPAYLVDKVLGDDSYIRVLIDVPDVYKFTGVFYRVGYPKALLMLSNGEMFHLEATRLVAKPANKFGSYLFAPMSTRIEIAREMLHEGYTWDEIEAATSLSEVKFKSHTGA